MQVIKNINNFDFESVPVDPFWNMGSEQELKMHRIHAYPAKFPAFITIKAVKYAQNRKIAVGSIADIFCGCGTTAFEAKRSCIDFWGCDLNPVATLIAKTKSRNYQVDRLEYYLKKIRLRAKSKSVKNTYVSANERLRYWFKKKQYNELAHLKAAICDSIPARSGYRLFFLCCFSNILKSTSVWLTKSIKPQVDPKKKPADVMDSFNEQCRFMLSACKDVTVFERSKSEIVTGSFLSKNTSPPKVDMIITSPPYVTSYEYADLHQLSSLWLDYSDDYRVLREGSIGSLHHDYNFNREWKRLNASGNKIVSMLIDTHQSKAKSVAKYFLDMQKVTAKSYGMLSSKGLALFVIGNTEYKGVRIDNAKHLAESLIDAGFKKVFATKRKISKKILTPYRDDRGKFSSDSSGRKVYSEEFIVIGEK